MSKRFFSGVTLGSLVTVLTLTLAGLQLVLGDNWCDRFFNVSCFPSINPTAASPNSPTSDDIIDRSGCGCIEADKSCAGVLIGKGDSIPASSILEPIPPNKDKIYIYRVAGEALEDGVVWSYVDNVGRPSLQACVDAQRGAFPSEYRVIEISETYNEKYIWLLITGFLGLLALVIGFTYWNSRNRSNT